MKPRPSNRWIRLAVLLAVLLLLIWQRQLWLGGLLDSRVRTALQQQEPERALWWLDWMERFLGRAAETELLRARAYRHLGRWPDVEAALKRADEQQAPRRLLEREQTLALAQSGQLRRAEPQLARLLSDDRDDPTDVCEAFVIGYMRSQRQANALHLIDGWLADAPQDFRPYLYRARIYRVSEELKQAEADYREALARKPHDRRIMLELAETLLAGRRYNEAISCFQQAVSHRELASRAYVGLAQCHLAEGRFDLAELNLRQAVQQDPRNPDANRELGRLLTGNQQHAAALPFLETAAALAPRDYEGRYLLGQCLRNLQRTEEAQVHFDFVEQARSELNNIRLLQDELAKNPRDVAALEKMGEIIYRYSDPDEGAVYLMAALDLNPSLPTAQKLLEEYFTAKIAENPGYAATAARYRQVEP
jgi:tetratricopeptide (TPR) repeat protein